MKFLKNHKNKFFFINYKYFVFLLFFIYLLTGLHIYKDYGISIDEPFQRTSGNYWYIWILENFFQNSEDLLFLKDSFKGMSWSSTFSKGIFLEYGPFFDLLSAFIESKFNIKDSQSSFHLKHLLNFLTFFCSSIVFYKLLKIRFKNIYLPLIGAIFFITSPRIFAESFYNCKDIIFMSFSVFSLFFCLKFLKKKKIKHLLLFSLFAAIATDIRIMGIFLIFLFILFFILECFENKSFLKKNIFYLLAVTLSYIFLTYCFWPFLWTDPFNNIIFAFKSFKNFIWDGSVFYLGNYIKGESLPWHYVPVWIFVTSPIIYILFFLVGFIKYLKDFFENFLNLDVAGKNKMWKNNNQKIDFFIFLFFIGPLFSIIIFNSTIYGGWRHLYFIYPAMIYILIYGLNYLLNKKLIFFSKKTIYIIVVFSIFFNIQNILKLHPFQNIYFNAVVEQKANKLFDIDYWGLANAHSLNQILDMYKESDEINLRTSSFTNLGYSKKIMKRDDLNKLKLQGTVDNNQEFIFTNYVYDRNPKYTKKYFIPPNYNKIFTLKKGNIIINEIYKKSDKLKK